MKENGKVMVCSRQGMGTKFVQTHWSEELKAKVVLGHKDIIEPLWVWGYVKYSLNVQSVLN